MPDQPADDDLQDEHRRGPLMPSIPPAEADTQDERREGKRGGPNTPEGKAVVRLNPVKHGVLSQTPVLPLVERVEDWERLRSGMFEALEPVGMLEGSLVDRIAYIVWRMLRNVRFETEAIKRSVEDVPRDWRAGRLAAGLPAPEEVTPEAVAEMDRMLMARLLPGEETLELVRRYEGTLHRHLLQTLHQLMVIKGLRKPGGRYYGVPELNPPGFTQPRGPSSPSRIPKYLTEREQEAPGDERPEG